MALKLLVRKDLESKLGGPSTSTIYAWMKLERDPLPTPIRIGANRVAWVEAEVDAWLKRRMDARSKVAEAEIEAVPVDRSEFPKRVFTSAGDAPRVTIPAGNSAFDQRSAL